MLKTLKLPAGGELGVAGLIIAIISLMPSGVWPRLAALFGLEGRDS